MAKVAIVGMGYVGKAFLNIFPDAVQCDIDGDRDAVNKCDMALIAVPTPSKEDGSCDISIVEDVISWLETPLILIKSAVEPGTTDYLIEKYVKRIVVSPEYIGEGNYWTPEWKYPEPTNPLTHEFMVLGGNKWDCQDVADIFTPKVGPSTRIRIVDAVEAEVVKYAENCWGAMKVTFANELRDICDAVGANWHQVREGWLDDPRVEPMHTAVFPKKRGFGGKCFPKDTKAMHYIAKKHGYDASVLGAVIEKNGGYVN